MENAPILYKNGVLLDLFLYSTFLAFRKSMVKFIFHFFVRTKKRNKKCAGSNAAGPLMPHKAANFIHEFTKITVFSPIKSLHISDGRFSYTL